MDGSAIWNFLHDKKKGVLPQSIIFHELCGQRSHCIILAPKVEGKSKQRPNLGTMRVNSKYFSLLNVRKPKGSGHLS